MLYVSDNDFVFYSLRYFEPVEFFENRSDVVVFWGFSNSTGESRTKGATIWGHPFMTSTKKSGF